ncbi:MAG: hypothetical protein HY812_02935 [Planctomycetes bacterium]|nr:hypothetical protein [Planctomycetota bacterium]
MKWLRAALLLLLPLVSSCFTRTTAESPLPGPLQDAAVQALPDSASGELSVTASVLLAGHPRDAAPWFRSADRLRRWLAEEAAIDARPDGELLLRWPSCGQELRGRVLEEDAPLSIACSLEPFAGAGETFLRLSAAREAPGYTRVRIDQWPFPGGREGEAIAEAHRAAWCRALCALRAVAAEGGPRAAPAPPPAAPPVAAEGESAAGAESGGE